jgi:hypothetical protein
MSFLLKQRRKLAIKHFCRFIANERNTMVNNRKLDFTLSTDYSVTMLLNPRSTSIFTDLGT